MDNNDEALAELEKVNVENKRLRDDRVKTIEKLKRLLDAPFSEEEKEEYLEKARRLEESQETKETKEKGEREGDSEESVVDPEESSVDPEEVERSSEENKQKSQGVAEVEVESVSEESKK